MKILMTTHTYLPHLDGVQAVNQYLAEGLVGKGHKVTIIAASKYTDIEGEDINGVHVIRWNARTVHSFSIGDKKGYQYYILSNQDNYDVLINICTQNALTNWVFPILDKIRIPRLLYMHSMINFKLGQTGSNFTYLIHHLYNIIYYSVYYLKNSSALKKYNAIINIHKMDYATIFFLKKYGITCHIIENATSESFFIDKTDAKFGLPNPYILCIANYNIRKNQKKCLEVFYKSSIPSNWKMILIGSNKNDYYYKLIEYNEKLRKELKLKKQDKKVYILAGIERNLISMYVKNSELFLLTSTVDYFPITIIESMAAGKPYISSNVGICKYLSGGVVVDRDEEYLYWLERFTKNDSLRTEYGKLAKMEALERYQISEKVNDLEKICKMNIGREFNYDAN